MFRFNRSSTVYVVLVVAILGLASLIRIADRNPEGALQALNQTRMTGLAPTLDRERRILEARALIDADREDLALDLLSRLSGRDADLLRVDGYWKAKNYSAASNVLENVYSADDAGTLNQDARMNIIKAAVGLSLANDTLGLSRLRSKFSDKMAQSAQWPMFDYITSPQVSVTGEEFKAAAKAVAAIDSITAARPRATASSSSGEVASGRSRRVWCSGWTPRMPTSGL